MHLLIYGKTHQKKKKKTPPHRKDEPETKEADYLQEVGGKGVQGAGGMKRACYF